MAVPEMQQGPNAGPQAALARKASGPSACLDDGGGAAWEATWEQEQPEGWSVNLL
jgi:hypothetical protein